MVSPDEDGMGDKGERGHHFFDQPRKWWTEDLTGEDLTSLHPFYDQSRKWWLRGGSSPFLPSIEEMMQ